MHGVITSQINLFRLDEQKYEAINKALVDSPAHSNVLCPNMKRCLFSQTVSSVATVRLDLIEIRHGYCLQLLFKVRLRKSSSWPPQVYNMTCNFGHKLAKDLYM